MGRVIGDADLMAVSIVLTSEEYETMNRYCKKYGCKIGGIVREELRVILGEMESEFSETGQMTLKFRPTDRTRDKVVGIRLRAVTAKKVQALSGQLGWPVRHMVRAMMFERIERIKQEMEYEEDE